MSGFQTTVNLQPAIGVAGDMWGANPRATVLAGEGALVSGPDGIYVGRFAWINPTDGLLYNTGVGSPAGFVAREQQAFITAFLGETSMWIPPGQPVTLYSAGDFLMKNEGDEAADVDDALYIDVATGAGAPGSTGTTMAASFTASIATNVVASTGSISTNTCTAAISGTTMTVSAILTGAVAPGMVLTGTDVAANTTVEEQLTGTAGSTGTYRVSIDQEVSSTTITGSGGCLTVVTMTYGTVWVGATLSGTGVTGGTTVLANITGSGGAGKYWVDTSQTVSGQAITASGGTMTVTAVASGTIEVNEVIVGGTTGSYVVADADTDGGNVTGTGGTGTYIVSVGETVGSGTVTIAGSVSSKWYIRNAAAVDELMKISSYALG